MDINCCTFSGKLNTSYRTYNIKNSDKTFGVFTFTNQSITDHTIVKVFVFDEILNNMCKNYLVFKNKGKILSVCGKLSIGFDSEGHWEIQLIAFAINLIDRFLSTKEIEDNKVDFND